MLDLIKRFFKKELKLPESNGHWELTYPDGYKSYWDVYIRRDWPKNGMSSPFATNEHQTDPCLWLGNEKCTWKKISDNYMGRLKRNEA